MSFREGSFFLGPIDERNLKFFFTILITRSLSSIFGPGPGALSLINPHPFFSCPKMMAPGTRSLDGSSLRWELPSTFGPCRDQLSGPRDQLMFHAAQLGFLEKWRSQMMYYICIYIYIYTCVLILGSIYIEKLRVYIYCQYIVYVICINDTIMISVSHRSSASKL